MGKCIFCGMELPMGAGVCPQCGKQQLSEKISFFEFSSEQTAILNGVSSVVRTGSRLIKQPKNSGISSDSEDEKKEKKRRIRVYIIVSIVIIAVWILQNVFLREWIINPFTKFLKYVTFFYPGLRYSGLATIGGVFGRGFVVMGICGIFTGSKGISKGAKSIFSGSNFKSINIGSILIGAGIAMIAYNFFSGYGNMRGIAIAVSGSLLSMKAIGQGNGLIRRFLGIFMRKSQSKLQGMNQNVGEKNNELIQGILTGTSFGFMLAIPVALINYRWTHLIIGIVLFIVGVVLFNVMKNSSNGQNYTGGGNSGGGNSGGYNNGNMPQNGGRFASRYIFSKICGLIRRNRRGIAFSIAFLIFMFQVFLPAGLIKCCGSAGNKAGSGVAMAAEEDSSQVNENDPKLKKGTLYQVVDGTELKNKNKNDNFSIDYEVKSNHKFSNYGWAISGYDNWCYYMDVTEGDRVEIDFTFNFPKSTKGEQVGPDFIESMAKKYSDFFYNMEVKTEDYNVGEPIYLIEGNYNYCSSGAKAKMVFEVPEPKSYLDGHLFVGFHSDSEFYGEADYRLGLLIEFNVTGKGEKEDVLISSDAKEKAGEVISFIGSGIVAGGISAGAGVAGAALSEGGEKKEKEEKEDKKYGMKIYKDFGNQICPGDSYPVYAKIVEITKGIERDRSDLSANIQIFSDDGVFTVDQDGGLSGGWKTGTISLPSGDTTTASEGRVNFKFYGKGGTFTNSMRFFINDPQIEFNQPNIALLACDRRGAYVGFKLIGIDHENCKIKVDMNKGSSYTAAWVRCDNPQAPNVYFAVLNDIDKDPGDSGTYEVNTLTVTVEVDNHIIEKSMDVCRVTEGLNFGADRIACYRLLKETSAGKAVQDLSKDDFMLAVTKVNAYILRYDGAKREVYYKPADVLFTFETPKKANGKGDIYSGDAESIASRLEDQGLSADEVDIDQNYSLQEKLNELGLTYKKTNITDSMTEYSFCCENAYLESPHRYHVVLRGRALDEDRVDDKGDEINYETTKDVILESQPYRPGVEMMTDADMKIYSYIDELDSLIYSTAFAFDDKDENGNVKSILGMLDSNKQTIFTKLCPYLEILDVMRDGYNYHYGFDTLKLAMVNYQINWTIEYHKKNVLSERQRMLEQMQETAHHDANSFWFTLSATFTQINEKYLDTWGGVAVRIAAGVATGGASEAVFLTMDVNKAMYQANEHKLLKDRTLGKTLLAGSVPVLIEVASAGVMKVGGQIIAELPASVKANIANWASRQTGKVIQKIPKSIRALGQYPKKLYKWASLRKEELLSMHYDPKSKCMVYYRAAGGCDKALEGAEQVAFKYIRANRGPLKSPMSNLKGLAHDAAELRAASTYKSYKKAVDLYKANPTADTEAIMKKAYFEMQQDSLAINKLNMGTRSGYAIENEIRHADDYIEMFNRNQKEYLKDASEPMIKDNLMEAALKKGFRKEDIDILYATGNKSASNLKAGMDIDLSPHIKTKSGEVIYFTQAETDDAVAKAWSKVTGSSYDDAKSLISKYKGRAVTPEDPEFYHQFKKVMAAEDISDEALALNMKEGMYKMTYEYNKAQKVFNEVVSDPTRYQKAAKELEDMLKRNASPSELSSDAKILMNSAEAQVECIHQVDKIRGIYDNYSIKGQAMGNADAIGTKQRVFGKLSKQLENQGTNHINLGEYDQIVETQMGGYTNNATELMECAKEATISARGLSKAATGKVFSNVEKGAGAGVSAVANKVINGSNGNDSKR